MITPNWKLLLVISHLVTFCLGWASRGCYDGSSVKTVADLAGSVSTLSGKRTTVSNVPKVVRDTVVSVVFRDRVRVEHVPARVVVTRRDTVVETMPFRADLDTVVNGGRDSLKVAFSFPPPQWDLVDMRRSPDTTRSILERVDVDHYIQTRPGFFETVGSAGLKGVGIGAVFYVLSNDASSGSPPLSIGESLGVGIGSSVLADTLLYLLE